MTRLVMQPLRRVEGHGRVELILRDGQLREVRLALTESPRLFERLVVGRSALEIPDLVCRICAICSAVHRLAALEAIERALAVEIPPAARLVRELLLLGGHLQSHALHLFCLILPDFSGVASVFDLVRRGDPLAVGGLELKAFGNRVQELAGGRVIHPVNAVPGGVVRLPSGEALAGLRQDCDVWLERWPRLSADFIGTARYPASGTLTGTVLAVGGAERFALQGDTLYVGGGDPVPAGGYAELLAEQPVPYSRARQSAGDRGPFLVGALARRQLWAARSGGGAVLEGAGGIHDNNTAQLAEIGWTLERIAAVAAELQAQRPGAPLQIPPGSPRAGVGTAAFEAPRGLLVHHYVVDDWGQVAVADIATPTAINQRTMERQLLADLAGIDDETELRGRAARVVRAFDPCISCAVHVIQC
ncbi:MAG: Ni/Fe hydrogenase subunit alpha [Deltaproteobacteria bacterium]|nr:MAG: Ni/Fe hydrogenase subunit alpha [Deltaproteobacteria bacterium]